MVVLVVRRCDEAWAKGGSHVGRESSNFWSGCGSGCSGYMM